MKTWTCSKCNTGREGKVTPRGWKMLHEQLYCSKCWKERYCLRAVTFPVASVNDWDKFHSLLKQAWADVTQCANWMLTEMYARDVRRNGQEKMPPMPRAYLYPEARKSFPQLPTSAIVSLEQAMQQKYRAKRYEVIWTRAASLPTYRYPTPLPIHNQNWRCWFDETNRPYVSLRLGGERMTLRLRGGPRYRRQLQLLRKIAAGEVLQGEMALYRVRAAPEEKHGHTILCKLVAWLPKQSIKEKEGGLWVQSSAESLLLALDEKQQRLWIYHADHLRRWAEEHRRQLLRWSDDQKAEQRPTASFDDRRRQACFKFRNRMNSATHQIAASVVNFATRRRVATLWYDDSVKDFCPQFPWYALKQKVQEKAAYRGIEFLTVSASVDVVEEKQEALAKE